MMPYIGSYGYYGYRYCGKSFNLKHTKWIYFVHLEGCFATTSIVETSDGFKQLSDVVLGGYVRTSSGGDYTHFTEVCPNYWKVVQGWYRFMKS